jgi:hypothetical protein
MTMKSKILSVVAVLAILLGVGAGVGVAATATPAGTGVQPDGSVIVCLHNKTHIYHSLVTGTKCVTGYTKITMAKQGLRGWAGPKGDTGARGPAGPAAVLTYGVARVHVARGSSPASVWATYSTSLGSPVGDTAGGTFRFTCSAANAPCTISVSASSTGAGTAVYPRIDVTRAALDNDTETNCEYADGVDNDGASAALTTADTTLKLGVGSTQSCGDQQTSTPSAVVSSISVPSGYYDVASTFTFSS